MYDSGCGLVVAGACVVVGELGRVVVGDVLLVESALPDASVPLRVVGTLTGTVGSGEGSAMVDTGDSGEGGSVATVAGAMS